jgi:hypothetical protein
MYTAAMKNSLLMPTVLLLLVVGFSGCKSAEEEREEMLLAKAEAVITYSFVMDVKEVCADKTSGSTLCLLNTMKENVKAVCVADNLSASDCELFDTMANLKAVEHLRKQTKETQDMTNQIRRATEK